MDAITTEKLNEVTAAARVLCNLRASVVEQALRARLQPFFDTAFKQIARAEAAVGFVPDIEAYVEAVATVLETRLLALLGDGVSSIPVERSA